MTEIKCGFYAVNNKHCIPREMTECSVCGWKELEVRVYGGSPENAELILGKRDNEEEE